MPPKLSKLTEFLVNKLDTPKNQSGNDQIEVNSLISDLASWYEKLRNVIDYKEEEVVLRAAIERILRRRMVMGGKGRQLAEPLVRELVWAKYLPNSEVPEQLIEHLTEKIESYSFLEHEVKRHMHKNRSDAMTWIFQILTGEIENIISPSRDKELMSNFIFQIFKSRIEIKDDTEQTKDAQVFIATKRAFDKHDLPFLRYDLFIQYFGFLNHNKVEEVSKGFEEFYKEATTQLNYPLRDTIHSYVKNKIPPFLILEEFFRLKKGEIKRTIIQPTDFQNDLNKIIAKRYNEISQKVSTAIKRSVLFVFITKATLALSLEVTAENLIYGSTNWIAIIINILSSPFLMILSTFFIKTPDKANTLKILENINQIVFEDNPNLGRKLSINKSYHKLPFLLAMIYGILWLMSLTMGIGAITLILTFFHFNIISQGVFVFFLIIVSFMSYRIYRISQTYTIRGETHGMRSLVFDFFFIPFIQLGKKLSQGVSQINIFLFVFDYLIETPFKEMFAFIEQWLFFLRRQRDMLE